jgi:hypothetical protein
MRKLLAAFIAVTLCCSTVFAQKIKQKCSLGFKAGANISSFRTAVDYSDFGPSPKLGQVFGAFVQIPLSSGFFIQPEFLYSQMGSKAESSEWGEVTFRYNYFSVPIMVKYNFCKTWNVSAGAEADFLIRARQKQNTKTSTITNGVKDFDFAFTAGIGTNGKKWTFDARYIHGSQDVSPLTNEYSFFNQGVQLTLGYKLQKKAKKADKAKK